MRLSIIGCERDDPTDQVDGDLRPSRLLGDDAHKMQGAYMFRLLCQDLPVKLLGLPQPTGPVMPYRQIEGLLDCEVGHEHGNLIHPFVVQEGSTSQTRYVWLLANVFRMER